MEPQITSNTSYAVLLPQKEVSTIKQPIKGKEDRGYDHLLSLVVKDKKFARVG